VVADGARERLRHEQESRADEQDELDGRDEARDERGGPPGANQLLLRGDGRVHGETRFGGRP
jgi:hypothetical protein